MTALFCALAFLGAGCVALQVNAQAEETVAEPAEALFMPQSYEQYLPLVNPSDAAFSEEYITVADGNLLYIFDRAEERYSCFSHEVNGVERNISNLQFSPDGRLFFSDQDSHLFLYRFDSQTAEMQPNIPCSTFIIEGDTLYTTSVTNNMTTFYAIPHESNTLSFSQAKIIGTITTSSSTTPCMFVKGNTLYCAVNQLVYAYTYNGTTYDPTNVLLAGQTNILGLTSVCVYGDEIYFTVSGAYDLDGFYRTKLGDSCEKLLGGTGFTSLMRFNDLLYCVKGATVRGLSVEGEGASFTGYEIGASSDSVNRLSNAQDSVRAKDLIVTNDFGNSRVSVYNTASETYDVIPCGAAACVATDGETIAVGVGNRVLLYRYDENEPFFDEERAKTEENYQPKAPYYTHSTENAVVGVSVVYGSCYYVTEHHYGIAKEGAHEFTRSNTPVALTNDVYGNLYVADAQGVVTRYTEQEFIDYSSVGEPMTDGWVLPSGFTSLRADFDGSLYYLLGGDLYRNGVSAARFSAGEFVYRGEHAGALQPVSVALAFEDNALYLQYGDFIVRSSAFAFPTLTTISAGESASSVFSAPSGEALSYLDVREGATGVRVDLGALTGESEFFAYRDYARTSVQGTAVMLAETERYYLAALFERIDSGKAGDYSYVYTAQLFLKEDCTPREEVWRSAEGERYTSHEVSLSYYPCLLDALLIERLPRSERVELLAVTGAGNAFSFGYVQTESGARGYVPLGYLSESPPVSPEPEQYTIGYLKASDEGVTFYRSDDRSQRIVVKERTQVRIYDTHDGLYLVKFTRDGAEYSAQITRDLLESGSTDALRMSVIIILCVVALGICVAYVLIVPRKKKK